MDFKSNKEFAKYLKILAEESVKSAYAKELSEASEDDIFGDEEDDGGGEEDQEDGDDIFGDDKSDDGGDKGGGDELGLGGEDSEEPAAAPAPQPEPDRVEKIESRPTPLTLELGEITSDGIISTLNMIRAGRSFKQADVSSELRKYIEEHLTDPQRLALATFLSALRDITSGEPASEAPSPDDENVNIDATDQEKEQNGEQPVQSQMQQQRPKRTGDLEDITAPIQVGPRNESIEKIYRDKIRLILNE